MPQTDELQGILSGISTEVDDVSSHVTSLHEQLQQLQETTPPQVDLTAVIEQARSIRDRLDSVSAAIGAPAAGQAQEAEADIGGAQGSGDGEEAAGDTGQSSDLGGQSAAGDNATGSADDGSAGVGVDTGSGEGPGPDQGGADATAGAGDQADGA